MLKTLWATIHQGKIELLESTELPEGTRVLVTRVRGCLRLVIGNERRNTVCLDGLVFTCMPVP
jgi:hypothetical protein